MNTPCSIALLDAALAGNLRAEEETALHQHLEECEKCGAALEQMAGGPAWCQEAASLLASDELDTALPGHSLAGHDEWSEADFTVEHLEPADEPGVLGRLGGYDVLEIIGRGGMGVVLKGYDRELKRCVAIKVLSPHLAQSSLARKRFAREAQAAAAVVHPNVLAIHQVQPGGRLPFLVMPLVAGESLAQRLTAQGRLELKEILRIGMQAAAGLSVAHEQGLVHRDVKPANILLEKGVERAVLTDFGLARAADDVTLTRWGVIAGTPQYMSPEQARGEALDSRSDLFSLGCVLYEMATGVSPFRTESVMATMRRLVEESPQALASLNPELPPWFIAIVDRLLEKDPARRFNTAQEVSELLEGCLAHVQQPASVPLPAALPNPARKVAGTRRVPSAHFKGVLAMVSTIGIICLGMFMVSTNPSDISGEWTGEDWGHVVLKKTNDTEYSGSFSDTVSKQPGEIQLKWSRIERRFNGAWREGEDRFGDLSIRLVGNEIRGALTTDAKSKINPATPRLADLTWIRERTLPTSKPSGTVNERVLIKSFDTTAKLISKDEISLDEGAWRIEARGNRTVRLFEIPELALEDCRVIYRAKLKSEKLQGQAYLEMWCRLPSGEYFSRGLQSPVTGTTDWTSYETPFFLKKGERADLIKLNLVIEGKGTLWIKDVELSKAPLEPARNVDSIDLPFVNDPDVLGEWKSVDFVASPSEFNPDKTNWKGDLYLKGLSFLPDGKTPWPWWTWTKGVLVHHGDKTASHYEVKEIRGQRYMFLEWKSGDVTIFGLKPMYYVLRSAAVSQVTSRPVVQPVPRAHLSMEATDRTLAEQSPVVVETVPVSGARDVAPGETEIRVRFSKQMTDGSWSWSTAWENSTPDFIGPPHYEADGRTCVAKAKLKPGRTYAFWLNSENFQNFTDRDGRPAVPYLLIFQTKPK